MGPMSTTGSAAAAGALPLVAYKRWRLRAGVSVDQVAGFVGTRIVPAYRALSGAVTLGLQADLDGATVLAVQRWVTREQRDQAMHGSAFEAWWAGYEPALVDWDELVEFVDEWETSEVPLPAA